MLDQNAPTSQPLWKLIIKWTVLIYAGGAAITFVMGLTIFAGALNSIVQALGLAAFYATLWPFLIFIFLAY